MPSICANCGEKITCYHRTGDGVSWWLHTAYGQPQCLSKEFATPTTPDKVPTVQCGKCGMLFSGAERKNELKIHKQHAHKK